jgi:hypothetical protein
MAYYKNVSGAAVERPGDGTFESQEIADGDTVEAEANPAPGMFEETKTKTKAQQPAETGE